MTIWRVGPAKYGTRRTRVRSRPVGPTWKWSTGLGRGGEDGLREGVLWWAEKEGFSPDEGFSFSFILFSVFFSIFSLQYSIQIQNHV
jgi:hypothetical protein